MKPSSNGRDGETSGPFLDRARRPRALWRLVLQYLTFRIATSLILNLLVVGWLLALAGGSPSPGGLDASGISGSPALPLASAIAGLCGASLSAWLATRFLDRRPFGDLSLDGCWWIDLFFGALLGALLMTGIFLAELALGWISVSGTLETTGANAPLALLFPVATFACVGIYEELVFRGYQLRNAAEGLNGLNGILDPRAAILLAWVLSSAFFGLLHADNPNATPLVAFNVFLAGLMLGFGYVLTGRLAIPIGLHITWNLFQATVYGFPVSGFDGFGPTLLSTEQRGPDLWTGGTFGPEAGLLGVAAMLVGAVLIALWTRLRTGNLSPHLPIAGERSPHNPPTNP